jgi:protein O-mannosyl-transferase
VKNRKVRSAIADGGSRARSAGDGGAGRARSRWVIAAVLLVATFAAYWPALSAGFSWDDNDYVTENQAIQSPDGLTRIWTQPGATPQYYPMVFTTFWLEYQMWKLNATGYHATNILLHALSALLLFLLLEQLEVPGAVLAAFAFALHPVCVESVAWVAERKNVLSTLFYLSSALVFFRTYDVAAGRLRLSRYWPRYLAVLALFALALLSKTVTSTLPVAILVVIWWQRGRLWARDFLNLSPMLAMGASLGAMTVWMERNVVGTAHIDLGLSFLGRIAVAGRAVCFYAGKLLWPTNLTFIYPRWQIGTNPGWQLIFPLLVVAAVIAIAALRERIGRAPLATLLLFVVTLFPALGFIDVFPMRYSFVADHFQYLAMLGPLAFAGSLVARACQDGPLCHVPVWLRNVALGAVAIALAVLTNRQARIYVDPQALWTDTLKKNPTAWLAHNNLGGILLRNGRSAEAREHFEEALRLNPEAVEAMVSLGFSRAEAGDLDEAVRLYRRALEIKPADALCLTNLGAALLRQGKLPEATAAFRQALDARPDRPEYHRNLALLLARTGDTEAAVRGYQAALKLAPRNSRFSVELARLLARTGRIEDARLQYSIARSVALAQRDSETLDTVDQESAHLGR